ncbi:hypothetical protein [Lunatimonas salinarum]|uniref:hypothetical protein n=1 Tax=Lunatimonas salinarum TaxID=1774590 RepID=UPI001AE0BA30|nr:hypothetical protein [Lunatimonas salinarum]
MLNIQSKAPADRADVRGWSFGGHMRNTGKKRENQPRKPLKRYTEKIQAANMPQNQCPAVPFFTRRKSNRLFNPHRHLVAVYETRILTAIGINTG